MIVMMLIAFVQEKEEGYDVCNLPAIAHLSKNVFINNPTCKLL
jgi:hypothetical protein